MREENPEMKEYYQSGNLLAVYNLDSELNKNGKAILYFDGGSKKSELFYKNGEKHGICLIYDKDGGVLKKAYFLNNKLVEEPAN